MDLRVFLSSHPFFFSLVPLEVVLRPWERGWNGGEVRGRVGERRGEERERLPPLEWRSGYAPGRGIGSTVLFDARFLAKQTEFVRFDYISVFSRTEPSRTVRKF